jgi:ubiquitin-protein ligase
VSTPRLRRLGADFERLTAAFAGHPRIVVQPAGPVPPERYRVIYNVPGLHQRPDNTLVRAGQHVVDVTLPGGYPREKPYCTTASPVFHPNFGNHICIADFWSPGQAIVDVVVQIGDMLQYKLYNTSSPLNAVAARWAVANIAHLPLGSLELLPLEPEVRLGTARAAESPVRAS